MLAVNRAVLPPTVMVFFSQIHKIVKHWLWNLEEQVCNRLLVELRCCRWFLFYHIYLGGGRYIHRISWISSEENIYLFAHVYIPALIIWSDHHYHKYYHHHLQTSTDLVISSLSSSSSGLHESLQPCSRAARKWRENEEMRRKWRENEEMERDWPSTFPHSLSISSLFLHFLILSPFPPSLNC